MTAAEYFAHPGISKSSLDDFARCPAYYRARKDGLVENESTPAMTFGTLLHAMVLDGRADYHTRPSGMTFTTKEGKAWRDAHQDKPIITADDNIELQKMSSAILLHPHAAHLFGKGKPEVALFGKHEPTGLPIKGRLDWLGERHIVDIKTTADASNRGLSKSIFNFRYHCQAAHYISLAQHNGHDVSDFYFIAIERGEFPLVNVKLLSQDAISLGRAVLDKQMDALLDCMSKNEWPDYSGNTNKPQLIDLPAYAYTDDAGVELIGAELVTENAAQ